MTLNEIKFMPLIIINIDIIVTMIAKLPMRKNIPKK